jgi:1-acyl-sn-glycerol-3-phosphate acyltransferase
MAKRELFETPLIGWALWPYGAFPVRRFSADMGALRAARNLLRHDAVVLMFPEGTRSKDVQLHPALPGAAMVALLAHAPVVPVAITGTEHIHLPSSMFAWMRGRRPRLRVEFGEPIRLDGATDSSGAEQATDVMMRRIAAMLPASYRGAYGPESDGQLVVARQEREAR